MTRNETPRRVFESILWPTIGNSIYGWPMRVRITLLMLAVWVLVACTGANATDQGTVEVPEIGEPTPTEVPTPAIDESTPVPTEDNIVVVAATDEQRVEVATEVIAGLYPNARDIEVTEVAFANENQILIDTCIWVDDLDTDTTQHAIKVDPDTRATEVVFAQRELITEPCTNTASLLDAARNAQQVLNGHTNYLSGQGSLDDIENIYSPDGEDFYRDIASIYTDPATEYELRHFPTTGEPIGYVVVPTHRRTMYAVLLSLDADPRAGYYLKATGELGDFPTNEPFTIGRFVGDEHVAGVLLDWSDGAWRFALWDDIDYFNCENDCVRSVNVFNGEVGHVESQGRDPNFLYDFALERNWRPLPEVAR